MRGRQFARLPGRGRIRSAGACGNQQILHRDVYERGRVIGMLKTLVGDGGYKRAWTCIHRHDAMRRP